MTAPMTSREELPTDEVTLADFIYSVRGYGDAVAKAKLLWPMLGVAQGAANPELLRHQQIDAAKNAIIRCPSFADFNKSPGLCALDMAEAVVDAISTLPSTGLPAPAPHAEVNALRALYEWYDRDGSVGGASEVFEAHRSALPSAKSRVMQAADKAARVVEGWSDSKRDYAERVTASPVSSTDRGGK